MVVYTVLESTVSNVFENVHLFSVPSEKQFTLNCTRKHIWLYQIKCWFILFPNLPQLLDLFMVWDWSTYLADYGQPASKYLRVNPNTALTLLEKWVYSENLHGQRRSMLGFSDAKWKQRFPPNEKCLYAMQKFSSF